MLTGLAFAAIFGTVLAIPAFWRSAGHGREG